VAARLIKVRSLGQSGLDLLMLSSSHFDPERTFSGFYGLHKISYHPVIALGAK
jgi:hypothetical protein